MGSPVDPHEPPRSLPLLRGEITLQSALESDDDILQRLAYPEQRLDFFTYLYSHRTEIELIVSHHLGVSPARCHVGDVREWIVGSFNVCVPVSINHRVDNARKRVLIRFPLPYKVGESYCPGNSDEKLRCEAAAFLWLQENCSRAVPLPQLSGFGFPSGQSFSTPERKPFYIRLIWRLRRSILSFLRYPVPCRYVGHRCPAALGIGYLVLDYIEAESGKMLSESWEQLRHDPVRRANLFKGLSRIILTMSQRSLPRIGSLTLDDRGILSLTNRPLTLQIHQLENEGVPTQIPRSLTYSSAMAYVLDLLGCHDLRLRCKPNSIHDEYDGRAQMAALAAMRAVVPHFLDRDLSHGPFVFTLTDLHQSNIFVDDDWNIMNLIDLEWACSLPIEMLHPPFWLTSRGIDQLEKGEHLDAYTSAHSEFLNAFEEAEQSFPPRQGGAPCRTAVMRRGWKIGNFWYFQALDSPKGLYNLFLQHIQPRFKPSHVGGASFNQVLYPYWAPDTTDVIIAKVGEKQAYNERLRKAFGLLEIINN